MEFFVSISYYVYIFSLINFRFKLFYSCLLFYVHYKCNIKCHATVQNRLYETALLNYKDPKIQSLVI